MTTAAPNDPVFVADEDNPPGNRPGETGNQNLLDGVWYTTEELAEILKIDPSSLRRWRTSKPAQGPPFVRLSGRVTLYSEHDVEEWLRLRRVDPGRVA